MKILVSILLSAMMSGVLSQDFRQPKEIASRRQAMSYSNSVIHQDPNHPEQTAESEVKVSFNPQQVEQNHYYNPPKPLKLQQVDQNRYYSGPKSIQDYLQQPAQNYQNQDYLQQPKYQNPAETQLFNVGYSVKFTNGQATSQPKAPAPTKFTRTNLDDGEIITGTRKRNEEVQVPNFNMSPQDYVSSAVIENKKHKISGIKPKTKFAPINYPNPKLLVSQANLSPTTQHYYKSLEQVKTPVPQSQQKQEVQQYSWRNLGPGVEIIRSTEIPTTMRKFSRSDASQQFDHVKALGRSQDFDYTNAIDAANQYQYKPQPPMTRSAMTEPIMIVSKLPMDTSLLREPVRIETRLLQEALASTNQFPQAVQETPNNYFQGYRTLPEEKRYSQEEDFRHQFKIYGKPQPVAEHARQPRFSEYDLETDLRPPPMMTGRFQRKMLSG